LNALVLTTIGATSRQERSNPLGWFDGGNGTWLVVAAAAGGPRNRAWYDNLAAHPDRVRIELDGKAIDVTAAQLHGGERAEAWAQITRMAPRFAGYARSTDREIPVIQLTRRDI
ncbi:nitroreductase family deazaflavin-dependent oxidoreductase, partial [Georgenia ruanii]|nr:nitroreductase family deazaflavin-dependent oxidoreductase [Georgenia ruanii]